MSLRKLQVVLFGIATVGCSVALTGCGELVVATGAPANGTAIAGNVHGGQQPIKGASVYFYAAGTTGYGQNAVSLLGGSGYVQTDASGSFNITGDYTCPSPSAQVYLTSVGGDTGSGVNNDSVLMAALGSCGNLSSSTFVTMNEVSSVAAAYALSSFMKPGSTAVGTSSTNVSGLVNAFNTIPNLIDVGSGTARATTPHGNGAVPQSVIYSIANIMAACVNTTGGSGPCSTLFAAATPPNGTTPSDTLSAMVNIAKNPGVNVAALFNIAPPKGTFQPSLTGAPKDLTISVEYTGGGLQTPQLPAVDAAGNVWVPNAIDPGTLSEFSPTGVPLSGTNGISGGGLSYPYAVALDVSGNAWSANEGNGSVSKHTSGGVALSPATGYAAPGVTASYALALDGGGNIFLSSGNSPLTKMNPAGTVVGQFTGGGLNGAYAVAVDPANSVWVANEGNFSYQSGNLDGATVSKFSDSGTAAAPNGFAGGNLAAPWAIAVDANANTWVANFNSPTVTKLDSNGNPLSGSGFVTPSVTTSLVVDGDNTVWTTNDTGSVSHLSNSGAMLSPANGYISPDMTGGVGIAVDASGNVWTTDSTTNSLFEFVGLASPTVVPLQAAVKASMLGKRP